MVCSVYHKGVSNPSRSCIKVMKWESEGMYIPMSCQQCEDAPCLNACPVKAISHDEDMGRNTVDPEVCIGCRTCVSACPFGAMTFDVVDRKVIKCDLCDGQPQCVRFCDMKAVDFVDSDKLAVEKKRDAALRLSTAQKRAAALVAES
jgi:Fe-S-cluster-containing hydrogenase component 2